MKPLLLIHINAASLSSDIHSCGSFDDFNGVMNNIDRMKLLIGYNQYNITPEYLDPRTNDKNNECAAIYPDDKWKTSHVVPIFKKRFKDNYRCVAI